MLTYSATSFSFCSSPPSPHPPRPAPPLPSCLQSFGRRRAIRFTAAYDGVHETAGITDRWLRPAITVTRELLWKNWSLPGPASSENRDTRDTWTTRRRVGSPSRYLKPRKAYPRARVRVISGTFLSGFQHFRDRARSLSYTSRTFDTSRECWIAQMLPNRSRR